MKRNVISRWSCCVAAGVVLVAATGLVIGRQSDSYGRLNDAEMAAIFGGHVGKCVEAEDSEMCEYKKSQSGCELVCTQVQGGPPPACSATQFKGMDVTLDKAYNGDEPTQFAVHYIGEELCRERYTCGSTVFTNRKCKADDSGCDGAVRPGWNCRDCWSNVLQGTHKEREWICTDCP